MEVICLVSFRHNVKYKTWISGSVPKWMLIITSHKQVWLYIDRQACPSMPSLVKIDPEHGGARQHVTNRSVMAAP